MQNEMRDRLIELKINFVENFHCGDCQPENDKCRKCLTEKEADYLLENGVIVPPCKVGARVYVITSKTSNDKNFYIFEDTITHYRIVEGCTIMCFENHLGVPNWNWDNVFLTKEEAEKALKEGANNG